MVPSWPNRQIIREEINEDHDQHQHDGCLKPTIAMNVFEKVMPRVYVIPRLCAAAFDVVFGSAH
jgi:hypothetical protein